MEKNRAIAGFAADTLFAAVDTGITRHTLPGDGVGVRGLTRPG